jgi:E3 ubiquitin-protein ligase DOA10
MNVHSISNVQTLRLRLDMTSEAKICLHASDVVAFTSLKRLAMKSDLFGFIAILILLIRLEVTAWNVSADRHHMQTCSDYSCHVCFAPCSG